jgi:antitoxin component YwqK of YwqJK toxin-antitoxin module
MHQKYYQLVIVMSDQKKSKIICASNDVLAEISEKYYQYIIDDSYVYKICCDLLSNNGKYREWLVIMQKINDTVTNEGRTNVVDAAYAKFRANKLNVIEIINVNDPRISTKFITNEYGEFQTKYEVGKTVTPHMYDKSVNVVCSGGIHYFKTLSAAYYYREAPTNYTGKWKKWHENGIKEINGEYVDGKRSGNWIEWFDNNQHESIGNYANGKQSSHWIKWFDNGNKRLEGDFEEGKRVGHWTEWYDSGCVYSEKDY